MGLRVEAITFDGQDLLRLLQMKDGEIRDRLSVWYTRFAPFKPNAAKGDHPMLKIDGYDEAIIGPAHIWRDQTVVNVLVYDAEKIRQLLMKDGMDMDEAREYIEFNIEGAYMGIHTPVLVWPDDLWDEE